MKFSKFVLIQIYSNKENEWWWVCDKHFSHKENVQLLKFFIFYSPKICHGAFVCEDRVELVGDITIGVYFFEIKYNSV